MLPSVYGALLIALIVTMTVSSGSHSRSSSGVKVTVARSQPYPVASLVSVTERSLA